MDHLSAALTNYDEMNMDFQKGSGAMDTYGLYSV